MGREEEVNFEGVSKDEINGCLRFKTISAIKEIIPNVRRSIQNGDKLPIGTHRVHNWQQIKKGTCCLLLSRFPKNKSSSPFSLPSSSKLSRLKLKKLKLKPPSEHFCRKRFSKKSSRELGRFSPIPPLRTSRCSNLKRKSRAWRACSRGEEKGSKLIVVQRTMSNYIIS